ncbi:hypothetical protein SDC9_44997 [bioreactor metagenome]|uniref:Uncharacterized protein n=1 Tax=bioreactor metagenome TaxID=1076179 RepID=A0A644W5D0_9ZZZZ
MPQGRPAGAVDKGADSSYSRRYLMGAVCPEGGVQRPSPGPPAPCPEDDDAFGPPQGGKGAVWRFTICVRRRREAAQPRAGIPPGRVESIDRANTGNRNAYHPTADPQAAAAQGAAIEVAAPPAVPAEARRLHARLHHDAEETELGYA